MIKVIIERNIAQGLEANYEAAVRSTLKSVLDAPGYISSEALTDIHRNKHRILITKWTSLKAWEDWHASDERKMAIAEITAALEEPEKITVFEAK